MSGTSGDLRSAADRLALFMQRYGVTYDIVARRLGWSEEQLRAYLLPEARRVKAASDIADTAVDKLMMRYRVALAHQTLKRATVRPRKPLYTRSRRSTMPTKFGRSMTDTKSIIHADVTPAQLKEAAEIKEGPTESRKRKRKVIVQPLHATSIQAKVAAKHLTKKDTDTRFSTNMLFDVRKLHREATQELICPIRLDVDLDGIRFQDTFLVDASLPACSPEVLASHIAQDEKMSDNLKDAMAESIRRQILMFTSSYMMTQRKSERLYPVYLDLVIEGHSLRDQFEWDISNDCTATQLFASTLCVDFNLPKSFEPAIVFSIYEQVIAYRVALSGHKWLHVQGINGTQPSSSAGYIEVMPPLDDIIRCTEDTKLWQPVVKELSKEERSYFSARLSVARAPTSTPQVVEVIDKSKRAVRRIIKDGRFPRPINPFIVFCQMQKDALGKTRRSASETRKIMGDMWRKCTEEEKEYYSQLTEVENEKRRRDHILDMRDRAIADWEEEEARRKGLLASSTLEASVEHFRGLLLENYMSERHEVDMNRPKSIVEAEDDDDNDEIDEMEEA